MFDLGQEYFSRASLYEGVGHVLEISSDLAEDQQSTVSDLKSSLRLEEPMSRLAQLVVANSVEAVIHDAYGQSLGQSMYNVLGKRVHLTRFVDVVE